MWAVTYGHTNIVNILLQAGADVNAVNDRRISSLMRATDGGCTDIVNSIHYYKRVQMSMLWTMNKKPA